MTVDYMEKWQPVGGHMMAHLASLRPSFSSPHFALLERRKGELAEVRQRLSNVGPTTDPAQLAQDRGLLDALQSVIPLIEKSVGASPSPGIEGQAAYELAQMDRHLDRLVAEYERRKADHERVTWSEPYRNAFLKARDDLSKISLAYLGRDLTEQE